MRGGPRSTARSNLTRQEQALLALTIVGFVVPHVMGLAVVPFVAQHGLDLRAYMHLDPMAAAQLSADVIIVFVAFTLWAYWEGRRAGLRIWWAPIPASALVGLCFAVPLFLLLRERAFRRQVASDPHTALGRARGHAGCSAP